MEIEDLIDRWETMLFVKPNENEKNIKINLTPTRKNEEVKKNLNKPKKSKINPKAYKDWLKKQKPTKVMKP